MAERHVVPILATSTTSTLTPSLQSISFIILSFQSSIDFSKTYVQTEQSRFGWN
jgi:hypothetical protein